MISRLSAFLRLSTRELVGLTLIFVASLPAVTARLYSSDEVQYYSYLRSLWFDHDVSFENEYRYFYEHNVAQSEGYYLTFLEGQTATGLRKNYGTMGAGILWTPFWAIADGWTRATGGEANGYSKPYIAAVGYGSAFLGFVAILLSIRAARIVVSGAGGVAAGIAVWLGSPLLFYMYVAPPFSHAASAFAVALFVSVWLHVRREWSVGGFVALGACAALMAMVREQDLFFAVGPALDFLLSGRDAARRLGGAIAGALAFALSYSPQLIAYKALNGHYGPASDVQRKMTWYSPHGLQVLLSPEHGFLFWTPLAALSIAGLVVLALRADADRRRIAWCLLLMFAAQAFISGAVESWTVAGAFGQRRFVCLTVLLVIGLAALLGGLTALLESRRRLIVVAVAVCVWWNVALMAEFSTKLMDRQKLELGKNAYDAFVTIPMMAPGLAYRYIFERSSFYHPPTK